MASPLPKIKHFSVRSEITKAIDLDPTLIDVVNKVGFPQSRRRPQSFSTLANIINSQLLSTIAAGAIWGRLVALCDGQVTAEKILSNNSESLSGVGLSNRKQEYIVGLAEMILRQEIVLETLPLLNDKELVSKLVGIRGLGVWSAQIYAMFALGRRDFYPARDLALQKAIQRYLNLDEKPDDKMTDQISLRWSPHRSSVALLMWKYHGATTLD